MLGAHSTLNTVVLGEGMPKHQIPPHSGHHACIAVGSIIMYWVQGL